METAMLQRRPRGTRRAGFTLLELVVVLLIIAILAGLAIPIVNMLGRSADMAASAKSQADLANNIELFFLLQKSYPQGFDSLLDSSGGALYLPTPDDPPTQISGLPANTITLNGVSVRLATALTASTLTNATGAEYRRSFTRAGFDFLYHHDSTVINSNNSGTVIQDFRTGSAAIQIAELNPTAGAALTLYNALIPSATTLGVEANTRVVAVGIGPRNSAIGKTITNCPTYPGADGKYYGRFVAFFKVYASGERATLVGVTDAFGRTPDYTQAQFNESLPNGARQP
jgi:prepilin-type N-terminal cleavage/methylation domain-containing protein